MNGLQTLTQWQIFIELSSRNVAGFINALPTIVSLVFLPAQAWVSDRLGRRVSLWVGILFSILGAGVQASAHSPGTFIVGRLFIGISTAWFAAEAVLITEIAYPSHRAKCTALYNCQFCRDLPHAPIHASLNQLKEKREKKAANNISSKMWEV